MSPHLEQGERNAVAFVFSCPGEKERTEGRPAAGNTGDNLAEVLNFMAKEDYSNVDLNCDDWTRDNVWITNAWSRVESKQRTGRSEATIPEVLTAENMSRLANELEAIEKVIVCCGNRAQAASFCLRSQGRLKATVTLVPLCHLGNRAINRSFKISKLEKKVLTKGKSRRIERLRRWSRCLYGWIADEQNV